MGYDVAIIGGGPAGAAAAISLARAGRRVLLLEKERHVAFKVGESLPPAARPVLRALDWADPASALPSYGNQAAWGSPALRVSDFIRDPHGPGWRLDRPRFDAGLRAAAAAAGAEVHEGARAVAVTREPGGWQVTVAAGGPPGPGGPAGLGGPAGPPLLGAQVEARWLLDCSGRARWLARRQGLVAHQDDRLIAVVAVFAPEVGTAGADRDTLTTVEAVPDGWWYTALLPGGHAGPPLPACRRVVVYHTDAGLHTGTQARSPAGYQTLLAQTEHVRARLEAHGYRLTAGPWVAAANSARLTAFGGDGWLAAGDAALSFDPLSSAGIFTALYAGLQAGQALHACLAGEREALPAYQRRLDVIYQAYLQQRQVYYAAERRWTARPFWRVRNAECGVRNAE